MKTKKKKSGFTLVELLTVMAVIAILIGLLVPALNMTRRIAKDTRQKAQFHSIDVALETYAGEMEQYPDSGTLPDPNLPGSSAPFTVGAQHLAEALVGRDLLGLDPWTTWNSEKDDTEGYWKDIYATEDPPKNSSLAPINQVEKSLDRRKGPYLNPESVEAFQIAQLYTTNIGGVYPGNLDYTGTVDPAYSPAPVLTDAYRVKTMTLPDERQVKAGSPILYYKANTTSRYFYNTTLRSPDNGNGVSDSEAASSIFNCFDNEELIDLGTVVDQNKKHQFDRDAADYTYKTSFTGRDKFYDIITNSKITTQVRPYNQNSYILMSAGMDGIFGTPDDIYNFNE